MGPALRRKENRVKHILHKLGLAFASIQPIVLVLVTTGAVMTVAGQAGAGETVIQKATEQFENNPLKVTSLGKGLFHVFWGRRKRYGYCRRRQHVADR